MPSITALLVAIALSASLIEGNVDVYLGDCETFAVLSAAGITFDGRQTTIVNGDIGVSPGTSVTGSYNLNNGSMQINSQKANQCQMDLLTAYNTAMSAVCPASNIRVELAGQILLPGVYCSNGGLSLSAASVTLDGNNDDNAQWIFQAATTLTTATSTEFIFINGAKAKNVYWALGTAATIGLSSSMAGNIFAHSAITFGHDSALIGRALAMTAISFESGSSVNLPEFTSSDTSEAATSHVLSERHLRVNEATLQVLFTPTVPLGACGTFALEAGSAMTFNGQQTTINTGSIGVSPGTNIEGNYKVLVGTVEVTSTRSNQCAADRIIAFNAAISARCSVSNSRTELSGLTLGPGVYCSGGAMTLSAGTLTLDAGGDPNAEWIFQMASSLITSPYTSFILLNGAQERNVYWKVGSSATIAYSSSFIGNIIAYASISFGHDSTLVGRGLAGAAVSFEGGSSITSPLI